MCSVAKSRQTGYCVPYIETVSTVTGLCNHCCTLLYIASCKFCSIAYRNRKICSRCNSRIAFLTIDLPYKLHAAVTFVHSPSSRGEKASRTALQTVDRRNRRLRLCSRRTEDETGDKKPSVVETSRVSLISISLSLSPFLSIPRVGHWAISRGFAC